jgi:hypothetical protein
MAAALYSVLDADKGGRRQHDGDDDSDESWGAIQV